MLTRSYPVDERGRWRRSVEDFVEDIVIVCAACGAEPQGRVHVHDEYCAFVPEPDRPTSPA
jgi:hypothetical protein